MLCALTARKLKPGTFEEFKAALRGGPIWPNPDVQPTPLNTADAPSGWKQFYALQNVEDEDEVITFGLFDGSLQELRAQQGRSGYRRRRQATDQFVASKLADGVYEVLVERSIAISSGSSPALEQAQRRRRARHRVLWRIVNPINSLFAGVAPWWVLLETKGRRTGIARTTPLARGPIDGDVVWLNSVHGRHALWVRNLEATPEVRIKLSGRWHDAVATVHEYDPAIVRRFNRYARSGPKTLGIDPKLVRVELHPSPTR